MSAEAWAGDAVSADHRYWRRVTAMVIASVLVIIAIYGMTLLSAVRVWASSDTYSIGFLVVPVSLYFIWLRRGALARLRATPLLPAFLLFFPFGFMWIVADAADVAMGRQLAFVGILHVLVLAVLGWPVYKTLLFPIQYLWLMVPGGDFLLPALQGLTTELTVAALNVLGVPSEHEGILIAAAGSTYRIVEQCAALDFLLSALAFSLVYAQLFYRRIAYRVAFVAFALFAAIAANLFRTTSIVFLTHITEGQISLAKDHQLYGWFVFLLAVLFLFGVGQCFRERGPSESRGSRNRPSSAEGSASQGSLLLASLMALMLAGLAPAYATYTGVANERIETSTICPPRVTGDWQLAEGETPWEAFFPTADLRISRRYHRSASDTADLFVAYYRQQRGGVELVSSQNRLASDEGWQWLSVASHDMEIEGHPVVVQEARLRLRDRRRLVWHWYWVDGRFTSSRTVAKLLQAKVTLLGGEQRSAFIALATEEIAGTANARSLLKSLIANHLVLSPSLKSVGVGAC